MKRAIMMSPEDKVSFRFGYFENTPMRFLGPDLASSSALVVDDWVTGFYRNTPQINFFSTMARLSPSAELAAYRPFLVAGVTADRRAKFLPDDPEACERIADSFLSQLRPLAENFLAIKEIEREVRSRVELYLETVVTMAPFDRLQCWGSLLSYLRQPRIALRMKPAVLYLLSMLCNDGIGEDTEAHVSLMILLDTFPAAGGRKRAVENVIHALVQILSRRAYTHGPRMKSEWDHRDTFIDPLTAAGRKIWNNESFSPSAASELRKQFEIEHSVLIDGKLACSRFGSKRSYRCN